MKETSYTKKRLFSEFNLLTVSDIFSCELTSKIQKKLSLHTFICLSSSLWGTRPGISHTLIFPAFCLLFYPTVLHRIT